MITLGSLFDGIGGWLLAAERAGIVPIWASEIDPFPQAVTNYHFPDVEQLGDITKLDGASIAPVDIVTMGSPCQDLSIAGKREGLHGERSGLFIRAVELIRAMRQATGGRKPRFVIWENVPGAFSSNRGLDFKTVLEKITEEDIPIPTDAPPRWTKAGMVQCRKCDVAWRVLDAQFFGVPQRRRRIFLVADFGTGTRCAEKILFEPECMPGDTAPGKIKKERAATGIAENPAYTGEMGSKHVTIYDLTHADEVVRPVIGDKTQSLNARMGTGGNQAPVIQPFCIDGNIVDREAKQNETGISKNISSTLSTIDKHAIAVDARNMTEHETIGTLQEKDQGGYSLNYQNPIRRAGFVRRLTPMECERLQGLPDNWTLIPGVACPDSKRYKAIGNGMAQPCADFILLRLMRHIREG